MYIYPYRQLNHLILHPSNCHYFLVEGGVEADNIKDYGDVIEAMLMLGVKVQPMKRR